jgi:anti-sigma regulatory factor (Ser/Thr protein kinase)
MTARVIWSQEAHFSPEYSSAAEARVFVGSQLNAHELTYMSDDVELVVSELVTNVLVHAHSAISVTLEELPLCVRLTVHNGSSAPAMVKNTRSTDEGGRGLLIVDRCTEDWGIDTATNGDQSVWAVFELQTPSYESWTHPTASARSRRERPRVEGSNVAQILPKSWRTEGPGWRD